MGNYLEVTSRGVAAQAPDRLDLRLAPTTVHESIPKALAQVNHRVEVSLKIRWSLG